jgi:Cu-processing system permease protein
VTWQVLARRDLEVLRADRSLLLFPAFFALFAAGIASVFTRGSGGTPLSSGLALLFVFAVPLTAGTVTHEAVPSAVSSGRTRLTLSLPHTRRAFLVGAGAARLAVTLASVATAVLVGGLTYAVRGGELAVVDVALVLALAVLLAAAFVAATLALTAGSTSTTLAAASTYAFVAVAFFWPVGVQLLALLASDWLGVTVGETAVDLAILCSPLFAFGNALGVAGIGSIGSSLSLPAWAGVLVLAAWPPLGVAVAVARFDRLDL